jgi:hypothetical protein
MAARIRTDGFVDPCIPTLAAKPPSGPDWVHEIKHDAAAAAKLRTKSFTLDGEAVVVGVDGIAVFDALHRRHKASKAILYAFDLLELGRRGPAAPAPQCPQGKAGKAVGAEAGRDRLQRAHGRGRGHCVPARLQAGLRGHRVKAPDRALSIRPVSRVGPMIRAHWAIENSLHWVMDMVFRDDECRVRTDNAPANFATCRHIAYNLTRKAPGKDSIRLRRKTAGWDDEYLASLVAA